MSQGRRGAPGDERRAEGTAGALLQGRGLPLSVLLMLQRGVSGVSLLTRSWPRGRESGASAQWGFLPEPGAGREAALHADLLGAGPVLLHPHLGDTGPVPDQSRLPRA